MLFEGLLQHQGPDAEAFDIPKLLQRLVLVDRHSHMPPQVLGRGLQLAPQLHAEQLEAHDKRFEVAKDSVLVAAL